jgi:hypothetical protein
MTLRLEALIEHWPGESLLFVRALPGLQVSGHGAADLQRRAGGALQAHLDWLVERDLIDQPSGEVELTVAEEAQALSASIGPLFVADLVAPSDDEVESALAVGRAALSDLIDAFDASARSAGGGNPEALRDVSRMDGWYASRLSGTVSETAAGDPIDELVATAGAFEEAVDAFVVAGEPDLFVRDGEEWTLAKLLRRRTGHLRERLIAPASSDTEE